MCTNFISFLQHNATWISGLGMLIFAGVQIWLMFAQNRQQLLLKRLELIQQFDENAFKFNGTSESATEVQKWFCTHQTVCAILLKKKDVKAVEDLFNYLMDIRRSPEPNNPQIYTNRIHEFNLLANKVTSRLGKARYGFKKENLNKKTKDKK